MRQDLPPLTWLRAFEAAARTLSFTTAAAELNVTQAAISKHVKSLELHLRHPLFLRHPRSLQLTRPGAAYLPKVQDALDRLALGTREVFGLRRTDALTLRCSVAFSVNWLAPRLPQFFSRHPGVQLRIVSTVWNDDADTAAFDLDIQYGLGDWPGIPNRRLTWDSLTPLCSPDLLPRLHSPDDLRHHRLLHVMGYHEGWGTWLRAAGAMRVDAGQGMQVDTSLTAFALAAQGAGVALGRSCLTGPAIASGLIAPFALSVPIDEAFYLLSPLGRDPHPQTETFVTWLLQVAHRDQPDTA